MELAPDHKDPQTTKKEEPDPDTIKLFVGQVSALCLHKLAKFICLPSPLELA